MTRHEIFRAAVKIFCAYITAGLSLAPSLERCVSEAMKIWSEAGKAVAAEQAKLEEHETHG